MCFAGSVTVGFHGIGRFLRSGVSCRTAIRFESQTMSSKDVIARYQAIVAAREQDSERLAEIHRDVEDVQRFVPTQKRGAAERVQKRLTGCLDRGLDFIAVAISDSAHSNRDRINWKKRSHASHAFF